MTLAPWEYLFIPFNSENFPDIFHPTWIASLVLLVILIVLYNVRTRALHRHAVYLEMWEWLWWTGPDHVQPDHHRVAVRVRLHPRPGDA